ncbi:hypothetical protein [Streptomyces coffeae]|uniref:Tat pathway signal sequence domain protein n=1 Tax=Streptomyces coffeae TaxID=621382 RepID=A0ABS1NAX2_9ACTN|nr:hypothetical protein [Streptomyces coffeae]MBL1097119.1 hypothetical protein [Streptomyces coffeae]
MSGIGPVEPAAPGSDPHPLAPVTEASAEGPAPETLTGRAGDPDSPGVYGRWAALPRRTRRIALALTGVVAAITVGCYLLLNQPAPSAPPPPPWPAQAVEVSYAGTTGLRGAADEGVFAFRIRVSAIRNTAVTVDNITQPYPALTLTTSPRTPITVRSGASRQLIVRISVRRCSGIPLGVELPPLDITLRNTRAIQDQTFLFGDAYANDLSTALRAHCSAHRSRVPHTP